MKSSVKLCINKLSDAAAKSELKANCEKFVSELGKLGTLDGLADSWESSGMSFWKCAEILANWSSHTQKWRQEWMNQLPRHLFAKPPRKSACQEAAKIIEPKMNDTQCGFCRGRSTTEQISTLLEIFEKSWEHAKDLQTCYVDLGKVYNGRLPRKRLWGFCGSTVLTGASCWPSNNCILVQKKIASLSTELNHERSALCWTPTMVCAVTTPLHSLYQGLHPTARRQNPTCEAISPGSKTHFANNIN